MRMKYNSIPRGTWPLWCRVVLILALLLGSTPYLFPRVEAQEPVPVVSVWSDLYGSSNVTDPGMGPGSQLTIQITVTGAPAFNGYEFSLYYDPGFLKALSIDERTGTVFNNPFVQRRELTFPGTVTVVVLNLGSAFTGGYGTLVHIVFNITNVGVSPLVLAAGTAQPSDAASDGSWTRLAFISTPIEVTTSDGYFKNVEDKLGPVADFSFSPSVFGVPVTFDASGSYDADNDTGQTRGVELYSWDFGDRTGQTTTFPVITHAFESFTSFLYGNFSVRLTVTDSDDFRGIKTRIVEIIFVPCTSGSYSLRVPQDCPTIQSALDSIHPGGTLSVSPGVYIESLDIRKSVRIEGYGPEATIIDGGMGIAVSINAQDATLQGFRITNKGPFPTVQITNSNQTTIVNNIIDGAAKPDFQAELSRVDVQSSRRTRIELNTIQNNRTVGITLRDAIFTVVSGNSILGGQLCHAGIQFRDSEANHFSTNTLSCSLGIGVLESRANSIVGNTFEGGTGIRMNESNDTLVRGNQIWGVEGIMIERSSGNVFEGNMLGPPPGYPPRTGRGVFLHNSPRNIWRNNQISNVLTSLNVQSGHTIFDPEIGLVSFSLLDDYDQDMDTSNTIDGKPVYYLIGQNRVTVPSKAGFVAIVDSSSITVHSLDLSFSGGVLVAASSNILLENLELDFVMDGIFVWSSSDLTIRNNRISYVEFGKSGIHIDRSTRALVSGNVIQPVLGWGGIQVLNSTEVTVEGNVVSDYLGYGIGLWASGIRVTRNTLVARPEGQVGITTAQGLTLGVGATQNLIDGNTIAHNAVGLIGGCDVNTVYHNNFLNNDVQAQSGCITQRFSPIIWNDGNGKGNFWSDYDGQDVNGDGVGDTLVPHLGFDNYPLTSPWTPEGQAAALNGRGAWPEHKRYTLSRDEDLYQTMFARAANIGSSDTWVQATFTVTTPDGSTVDLTSSQVWVEAGSLVQLTVLLQPSLGVYNVTVRLKFSTDGFFNWTTVTDRKTFSFVAVP